MAAQRKAAGTAVDRRNGQRLIAVGERTVEPFEPPGGLHSAAQEAWRGYWADRQSYLLTESGKAVLVRWIVAFDRFYRYTAKADLEPLVESRSNGAVMNPLYRVAENARHVMEAAEKQLGIGGLNAASLGLAAISEARSLASLNEKYGGGDRDDRPAGEDPRRISSAA